MKLILIGTDHRLQQSVAFNEANKTWNPRDGSRFRKLVIYCVEKLGARLILEEAHARQERVAPTICSIISKQMAIKWQAISLGQPGLADALFDRPISEVLQSGAKPEILAGRFDLQTHEIREAYMFDSILKNLQRFDCILAVVGFMHLGTLAKRFGTQNANVEALVFTHPLVVDETKA